MEKYVNNFCYQYIIEFLVEFLYIIGHKKNHSCYGYE